MIKNYLKVALRNLFRYKIFSLINMFGLAIGLTVSILVYLDVHDEFTFDQFNTKADRIFRVVQKSEMGGYTGNYARISNVMSGMINSRIPGIMASSRYWTTDGTIKLNKNIFPEQLSFVDPDFLNMFTFPLIDGGSHLILNDKSSIIITKSLSHKYFGNINPIGRSLYIKYGKTESTFIIRGVAGDPPENSSIQFSILLPFDDCLNTDEMSRSSAITMEPQLSPIFFIELSNPESKKITEEKITELMRELTLKNTAPGSIFSLQPIMDIHFGPQYQWDILTSKDVRDIYVIILLAFLILFLVSANFVNLSIARSSGRFKEIGIRKVMGSGRRLLILQLLLETILLTLFALVAAIVISELMLPAFNNIIRKKLSFDYTSNPEVIFSILFITIILAVAAGAYPAFYLSKLKPSCILKGTQRIGGSNLFTRVLVISQFIIAIFLIVCAIVISNQNLLLHGKNLGFDSNNILVLNGQNPGYEKIFEIYKNEISRMSFVQSSTITRDLPGREPQSRNAFRYENITKPANYFHVDYDYLSTLGISMKEGRWFSKENSADYKDGIIVNDAFIKEFGISNPLGKNVIYRFMKDINKNIVGVINDYNYLNLHDKTGPLVLMLNGGGSGMQYFLLIKFKHAIGHKEIAELHHVWNNTAGLSSFNAFYLSSYLQKLYLPEKRWRDIVGYLSVIAIFIACLGLFGLVNYSTQKREKEIGIRKIMGASTYEIIRLLSKEFMILQSAAYLVACPAAYYVMTKWLSNFAYKINIGPSVFIITVVSVGFLTFITAGFQTFMIATANPVKTLRYE